MQITIDNSYIVFDLDDTLFPEIDYLKSAYRHISQKLFAYINCDIYNGMVERYYKGENVFEWILNNYNKQVPFISMRWLIEQYRDHYPKIAMSTSVQDFLHQLNDFNIPFGLVTDGKSITQRNKLKALNIEQYFKDVIISEEFGSAKPDKRNYLYFQTKYPDKTFYFFGDNTNKDFIVPAMLGWNHACLKDKGTHIHKQILSHLDEQCYIISSFREVRFL